MKSNSKSAKNIIIHKILKIIYNSPLERNINLILRYSPIARQLKNIAKKNKNLRVLEIGSGSIGITRFYNGEVVGIDVESEKIGNDRLRFLKSSATNIPFKDESFDAVISVDTLEHLTRKEQVKMVLEAYRVSKKYIMFTYPIGFNKYHEKILKTWKKSHLTKSLEEHLHGGTATGNEVPRALKGNNCKIAKEYGVHPALAYYLNYLEQYTITKILSRTVLKAFLPIFKRIKGDVRVYYFITKND